MRCHSSDLSFSARRSANVTLSPHPEPVSHPASMPGRGALLLPVGVVDEKQTEVSGPMKGWYSLYTMCE